MKFTSKKGSVSKEILKIWYSTILERKISYAVATWYDKLSKSHGTRLISSIQAQCLLLITGAYKKTPTLPLCQLTGIPPMELKLKQISATGKILRLGVPVDQYQPFMFHNKTTKSNICPYREYYKLATEQSEEMAIDIFTDGSKMKEGTGLAFCAFDKTKTIHQFQLKIRQENTVFQAELIAISKAIDWATINNNNNFIIHTDSQSGLKALEDINTTIPIVQQIIKQLQDTTKTIKLHWVRGHTGLHGNELADRLAKDSITMENINQEFHPLPPAFIKKILKQQLLEEWQFIWDYDLRGRFTHQLLPKVSESNLLHHRNLYLFATDHAPFPFYLHKFGRTVSKRCTCGQMGTALHYLTKCTLTSHYHLKITQNISLASWFKTIIKQPILLAKIINCINLIENNQILFHMPRHHLLIDDDDGGDVGQD